MSHRIHLYVHGRGRGHATRCLAVAHRLQARGFEVRVFAGPDAVALLQTDFETHAVPSLPPSLGARAIMRLTGRSLAGLRSRYEAPALVVSDGDLPGVLLGRARGVPTIAIGHGLTFACCAPPPGASRLAWRAEATKAWVAGGAASHRVAVNFVPLAVHDRRARLARPSLLLPERGVSNGRVLCYFRDEPHRLALRTLVDRGREPLLFSNREVDLPGVEVRPLDRETFLAALATTQAVVASAGSQLISECVALGIPFFGVYRAGDYEQELNVTMLRSASLGDGCAIDGFQPAAVDRWLQTSTDGSGTAAWRAPTVADVVAGLCEDLA